ncbi:hypothetical protein [Bacillus litorisediminis]|uniref:hypothetical protein n=1 Tax=Bacillus litorisediminis TaxID=2922713 RepID=UPI001FAF61E5|nr:hypothetical protein [Bacillus litorisediminis]
MSDIKSIMESNELHWNGIKLSENELKPIRDLLEMVALKTMNNVKVEDLESSFFYTLGKYKISNDADSTQSKFLGIKKVQLVQ